MDIVSAIAAYQQASEAFRFRHAKKDKIEWLVKKAFGATEGPVCLDQLLDFAAKLCHEEETAANKSLKEKFAQVGTPVDQVSGSRLVLVPEFRTLVEGLWRDSGKEPAIGDCHIADMYWKCCGKEGETELTEGRFIEIAIALNLHLAPPPS